MNNKEQIAKEKENIQYCKAAVESYTNTMNESLKNLERLEKDGEVKPVFPANDGKGHDFVIVPNFGEGARMGLTARSEKECDRMIARMKARAYVIEAINKANGGLNGFIYGKDNYFYTYRHQTESIDWLLEDANQQVESCLFCRNLTLIDNEEFKSAYKTMLGIK